jgi:hypothetical protein
MDSIEGHRRQSFQRSAFDSEISIPIAFDRVASRLAQGRSVVEYPAAPSDYAGAASRCTCCAQQYVSIDPEAMVAPLDVSLYVVPRTSSTVLILDAVCVIAA